MTIEIEREDDGRYFASWTCDVVGGCANYSTTVVGALAELCATLLKVDEDNARDVASKESAEYPNQAAVNPTEGSGTSRPSTPPRLLKLYPSRHTCGVCGVFQTADVQCLVQHVDTCHGHGDNW